MKRSTERILTTHVGSLRRPADLRAMWTKKTSAAEDEVALQARLRSAVGEVVPAQKNVGIDILNDGEIGKPMRVSTSVSASAKLLVPVGQTMNRISNNESSHLDARLASQTRLTIPPPAHNNWPPGMCGKALISWAGANG